MADGEFFSARQRGDIERAVQIAEQTSGLSFAAFVGVVPDRTAAEARLVGLPDAANSVLVAVDPGARTVDVVTGPEALRWLPDDRCRLAILTMGSRFAVGDISGGLRAGLALLGEQAAHPPEFNADEPD
ncbi:MAG: DUF5130 family protein [Candidatus Nanopelagicales bacterium]